MKSNRKTNTNYQLYLERKIDRELEKSILSIIDNKVRKYNFNNIAMNVANRTYRSNFKELSGFLLKGNSGANNAPEFSNQSGSQLLSALSGELQRAIFRNL